MDIKRNKPQRKWFGKRNILTAFGVLCVVAIYMMVSNLSRALPSITRANVWIDTVTRGDMVYEIRSNGMLEHKNVRWVASTVAGIVKKVLVDPGEEVESDTDIIRLENPALKDALKQAQAKWSYADADYEAKHSELKLQVLEQDSIIAKFKAAYEIKHIKAKATEKIYARGIIPKVEMQQLRIELEQSKVLLTLAEKRKTEIQGNINAQLRAAEALREQERIALSIAERNVESLNVKAGISGILQNINIEQGQEVAVGTSIALVAKPTPLRGRLRIPEMLAKDLSVGLKVLVDIHGGVVEGKVSQIEPSVTNGNVMLYVTLKEELPSSVRADTSIEARIVLNNLSDVVSIARPSTAASNSIGQLYVLGSSGKVARKKQVVYGAVSSDRVQILQGLEVGDQVVVSDLTQWSNYDALRLD